MTKGKKITGKVKRNDVRSLSIPGFYEGRCGCKKNGEWDFGDYPDADMMVSFRPTGRKPHRVPRVHVGGKPYDVIGIALSTVSRGFWNLFLREV